MIRPRHYQDDYIYGHPFSLFLDPIALLFSFLGVIFFRPIVAKKGFSKNWVNYDD